MNDNQPFSVSGESTTPPIAPDPVASTDADLTTAAVSEALGGDASSAATAPDSDDISSASATNPVSASSSVANSSDTASDYAAPTTFNFAAANEFSSRKAPARVDFDKPVYSTGFNTATIPSEINRDIETVSPAATENSPLQSSLSEVLESNTKTSGGEVVFTAVKKPSKVKLIVGLVVATILLGGVGLGFAVMAWRNQPENIAASAISQLISAPSVSLSGDTRFSLVEGDKSSSSAMTNLITAAIAGLIGEVKITSNTISQQLPNQHDLSVSLSLGRDGKHAVGLGYSSLIFDGDELYLQVKGIGESIGSAANFASDLDYLKSSNMAKLRVVLEKIRSELKSDQSKLKKSLSAVENQWWRVKLSEVLDSTSVDNHDKAEAKKLFCVIGKFKNLSNHKDPLLSTYKGNQFISLSKSENQNGAVKGSTRYKINLSVSNFEKFINSYRDSAFIKDLKTCLPEESNFEDFQITDQDRRELEKIFSTFSAGLLLDIDNWSHQIKHLEYEQKFPEIPVKVVSKYNLSYAKAKKSLAIPSESLPIFDLSRKIDRISEEVLTIVTEGCGGDIFRCVDLDVFGKELLVPPTTENPIPKPVPTPKPQPAPSPQPAPTPKPQPSPVPLPRPNPSRPSPRPRPEPIPIPAPIPRPVPEQSGSDPLVEIKPVDP